MVDLNVWWQLLLNDLLVVALGIVVWVSVGRA